MLSSVDPELLSDEQRREYTQRMQMRLNEQMAQMVQQQQAAESAIASAMAAKEDAERKLLEAMAAQAAAAEAAAAAPTPLSTELDAAAFHKMWTMGQQQERSVGRPREWNGGDEGFEDFQFKFVNYMSGMPGASKNMSVRRLLSVSTRDE